MPPCCIFGTRSLVPADWRGLVWRLAMLRPSTTTNVPPAGEPRRNTLRAELGAAVATDDALDRATLAGVLAGEHDDGVALADLGHLGRLRARGPGGHHSTSGASETIFM